MVYKNTKTGQVVKTTGRVSGKDWELVEKPKAAPAEAPKKLAEAPKKPTGKKKAGEGA